LATSFFSRMNGRNSPHFFSQCKPCPSDNYLSFHLPMSYVYDFSKTFSLSHNLDSPLVKQPFGFRFSPPKIFEPSPLCILLVKLSPLFREVHSFFPQYFSRTPYGNMRFSGCIDICSRSTKGPSKAPDYSFIGGFGVPLEKTSH